MLFKMFRSQRQQGTRQPFRYARPILEELEDRMLLATLEWNGGGAKMMGDPKWTNGLNWNVPGQPMTNGVPNVGDTLMFPAGTTNDSTMNKAGLTGIKLIIDPASTINISLQSTMKLAGGSMGGGTISAAAQGTVLELTQGTTFTWTGGKIGGAAAMTTLQVDQGATLVVANNVSLANAKLIVQNGGTVSLQTGYLNVDTKSSISNSGSVLSRKVSVTIRN